MPDEVKNKFDDCGAPELLLKRVTGNTTDKGQLSVFRHRTSFVIVGLMFEYGAKSGQFFQPKVNHRRMDLTFLYEQRVGQDGIVKKPILNSMLNPQMEDCFGRGNPITLSFYEYEKISDASVTNRDAGAVCTFWDCAFGTKSKATGSMRDVRAKNVTGTEFARLLELFNIKWVDENNEEVSVADGVQVTAKDWASFFGMFEDCDFKTRKGLLNFVERYRLRGFQVQQDLTVTQNLRLMALWIRSWQNIRPMVGDGKHRSMAMATFLHGFFEPKPTAPILPSNTFPDNFTTDLGRALIGEQLDNLDSVPESETELSEGNGENDPVTTTPRPRRGKSIYASRYCIEF